MRNLHVKTGDEVVVISGAHKGRRGKIIAVKPKKQQVLVEGVRLIKKHIKKNQQNPQGAIAEREGPIHASNVMTASRFDARAERRQQA